jgi:sporulation protein YlmC with PRC-barrel domain
MMSELKGSAVVASDGRVGPVADAYFDEERWAVRYLVVDTREWWPDGKALISPASVPRPHGGSVLRMSLTREQVKNAPDAGEDPSVSRLLEAAHAHYYGYPYYWNGPYLWGESPTPLAAANVAHRPAQPARAAVAAARLAHGRAQTPRVRSVAEVIGYEVDARDGAIGIVEDFVVDPVTWAIMDLVINACEWRPGAKVLIPPGCIADVDWEQQRLSVFRRRDDLRQAPETG